MALGQVKLVFGLIFVLILAIYLNDAAAPSTSGFTQEAEKNMAYIYGGRPVEDHSVEDRAGVVGCIANDVVQPCADDSQCCSGNCSPNNLFEFKICLPYIEFDDFKRKGLDVTNF